MRMIIIDSLLIVYQDLKDSLFSVFRLPDCSIVSRYGSKGKGPFEFSQVGINVFCPTTDSIGNPGFSIINRGNKLQFHSISDFLQSNLKPYKIDTLPPGLSMMRAGEVLADSVLFGAPYGGEANIYKFNLNTGESKVFMPYFKIYPNLDKNEMRTVYGCYLTSNPDNTMLALTYRNAGKVEFFDLNKNNYFCLSFSDFPPLEKNLNLSVASEEYIHTGSERVFSFGIESTKKYIYILVFNTVYKKLVVNKELNAALIPEILVVKWDGTPVGRILLSSYFSLFAVDELDHYIYTVDFNCENKITRYNISQIFEKIS
jgi:hypothetical protein